MYGGEPNLFEKVPFEASVRVRVGEALREKTKKLGRRFWTQPSSAKALIVRILLETLYAHSLLTSRLQYG